MPFVPPSNLEDFFARYPKFVEGLVWRVAKVPYGEIEDLISDVYVEMARRKLVESYDPTKRNTKGEERSARHEERMFLDYVSFCVRRYLLTLLLRRNRQTLNLTVEDDAFNASLEGLSENEREENFFRQSRAVAEVTPPLDEQVFAKEFMDFVWQKLPGYYYAIQRHIEGASIIEIARSSGINEPAVRRILNVMVPRLYAMMCGKIAGAGLAQEVTHEAYKKLLALGDFEIEPRFRKKKVWVTISCYGCSGTFDIPAANYASRFMTAKSPVCCSHKCSTNLRKKSKKLSITI